MLSTKRTMPILIKTYEEKALLEAIKRSDAEKVAKLLKTKKSNINLNPKIRENPTFLTVAINHSQEVMTDSKAFNDNFTIIKHLIEAKADLNCLGPNNSLMNAFRVYMLHNQYPSSRLIQMLIEKGAVTTSIVDYINLNKVEKGLVTPLIMTMIRRDFFMLKFLCSIKSIDITVPDQLANKEWPPIQWAAISGDKAIFDFLSEKLLLAGKLTDETIKPYREIFEVWYRVSKSDINEIKKLNPDKYLPFAFDFRVSTACSDLLDAGADPDFIYNGMPALFHLLKASAALEAIKHLNGQAEQKIFNKLMECKVNVNIVIHNQSYLCQLINQNPVHPFFDNYFKLLIQRGSRYLLGELPLHIAVKKAPTKLKLILSSKSIDIQLQDDKGDTFLHKFLQTDSAPAAKKEIIDIYCEQKGSLEIANHAKITLLGTAIIKNDLATVIHLIGKGAPYNIKEAADVKDPILASYFNSLVDPLKKMVSSPIIFKNIKTFVEKEEKRLTDTEREGIQEESIQLAKECLTIFGESGDSEDPVAALSKLLEGLEKRLTHRSSLIRLDTAFKNTQMLHKYYSLIQGKTKEISDKLTAWQDKEARLMLEKSSEKVRFAEHSLISAHKEKDDQLLLEELEKQKKYYKNALGNFNKRLCEIQKLTRDEKITDACFVQKDKLKNSFVNTDEDISPEKYYDKTEKLKEAIKKINQLTENLEHQKTLIKPEEPVAPPPPSKKKEKRVKKDKREKMPPQEKEKKSTPVPAPVPAKSSLASTSMFKPVLEDKFLDQTITRGNEFLTRFKWDKEIILNNMNLLTNKKEQFKMIFDITVLLKALFLVLVCKSFSKDKRLRNKSLYYLEHIVKTHDVDLSTLKESFKLLWDAVVECYCAMEGVSEKLNSKLAETIRKSCFALSEAKALADFEKVDFAKKTVHIRDDIAAISTSSYLTTFEKLYLQDYLPKLRDCFIKKLGVVPISHARNQRAIQVRH